MSYDGCEDTRRFPGTTPCSFCGKTQPRYLHHLVDPETHERHVVGIVCLTKHIQHPMMGYAAQEERHSRQWAEYMAPDDCVVEVEDDEYEIVGV